MFDKLTAAIAKIKESRTVYGAELSQSESQTRYVLVDPLLRALGWDTANLTQVRTEYPLNKWKADYVLMGEREDTPVAVIEVKKLNHELRDTTLQVIQYATWGGIPYALLTDGNRWQVFDVFKGVPFPQNQLLDLRLDHEAVSDCCLSLLLLWRPNLSVSPPKKAQKPRFVSFGDPADQEDNENRDRVPLPLDSVWTPLTELTGTAGEKERRPVLIRYADGTEFPVSHWYQLVVHTTTWLYGKGSLIGKTPIKASRRRYIVSEQPVHADGKAFTRSKVAPSTNLHVEINVSGRQAVQRSLVLLEHCHEDPQKVMVKH